MLITSGMDSPIVAFVHWKNGVSATDGRGVSSHGTTPAVIYSVLSESVAAALRSQMGGLKTAGPAARRRRNDRGQSHVYTVVPETGLFVETDDRVEHFTTHSTTLLLFVLTREPRARPR